MGYAVLVGGFVPRPGSYGEGDMGHRSGTASAGPPVYAPDTVREGKQVEFSFCHMIFSR